MLQNQIISALGVTDDDNLLAKPPRPIMQFIGISPFDPDFDKIGFLNDLPYS
jgi:hypothetical protein